MKKTLNFLMKCVGVEWKKQSKTIYVTYIYIYLCISNIIVY